MTDCTLYLFWLMPFDSFAWQQNDTRPLDICPFPSLVYAYMHARQLLKEHPQATCVYFKVFGDEEFYEQTRPA